MLSSVKQKLRRAWDHICTKLEKYGRVKELGSDIDFRESYEAFLGNGAWLMEENISTFNGITNPIRCLSVKELKTIKIDTNDVFYKDPYAKLIKGVWEGRSVLVKLFTNRTEREWMIRDIVVSTRMGTHNNVHKLLACCLETNYPVIIYEFPENGSLKDRILGDKSKNKAVSPLGWEDRIRIAWEISHAMSYLHTAFRRPIVHRALAPMNLFLDNANTAKLSEFLYSVSIPEGEEFVEDVIIGYPGYTAPEYMYTGKVSESADVYSFGMLFLFLITGKTPAANLENLSDLQIEEVLDPAIATTDNEYFLEQIKESVKLVLDCAADVEIRPTMLDVAIQLKNLINAGLHYRP